MCSPLSSDIRRYADVLSTAGCQSANDVASWIHWLTSVCVYPNSKLLLLLLLLLFVCLFVCLFYVHINTETKVTLLSGGSYIWNYHRN